MLKNAFLIGLIYGYEYYLSRVLVDGLWNEIDFLCVTFFVRLWCALGWGRA